MVLLIANIFHFVSFFALFLLSVFCADISHGTGFTDATVGPRDVESLKNFVLDDAEKTSEAKLQAGFRLVRGMKLLDPLSRSIRCVEHK
jgi:hypothetical protein